MYDRSLKSPEFTIQKYGPRHWAGYKNLIYNSTLPYTKQRELQTRCATGNTFLNADVQLKGKCDSNECNHCGCDQR